MDEMISWIDYRLHYKPLEQIRNDVENMTRLDIYEDLIHYNNRQQDIIYTPLVLQINTEINEMNRVLKGL